MYPTLVAVTTLGGSATRSELMEKVPEIAGVTSEQLAVVFPEDYAKLQGMSKVFFEVHWALSCLKAIGALDNSRRGVWSITQKGLAYLEMDRAEETLKRDHNAVAKKRTYERRKARDGQPIGPAKHDLITLESKWYLV